MTRAQRVRWLVVAAAIAVAAFLLLRDNGPDDEGSPRGDTAAVERMTPDRADPRRAPQLPVLHAGKVARIRVDQGDPVRFLVRAPAGEEVHVHGYDRAYDVPASGRVRVAFKATLAGAFEIELEHAGTQIAKLEVEP